MTWVLGGMLIFTFMWGFCQDILQLGVGSLLCNNGIVVHVRGQGYRDVTEQVSWGVVDSLDTSDAHRELYVH